MVTGRRGMKLKAAFALDCKISDTPLTVFFWKIFMAILKIFFFLSSFISCILLDPIFCNALNEYARANNSRDCKEFCSTIDSVIDELGRLISNSESNFQLLRISEDIELAITTFKFTNV